MKRTGLVGAPAGWTHFVNSCEVVNKREYFIHRDRYVNVTERGDPNTASTVKGNFQRQTLIRLLSHGWHGEAELSR